MNICVCLSHLHGMKMIIINTPFHPIIVVIYRRSWHTIISIVNNDSSAYYINNLDKIALIQPLTIFWLDAYFLFFYFFYFFLKHLFSLFFYQLECMYFNACPNKWYYYYKLNKVCDRYRDPEEYY